MGEFTAVSRLRRALPALFGLIVVGLLGVVAVVIGQVSLHASERQRVEERSRLVEDLARYASAVYSPNRIQAKVDEVLFSPTDLALDRRLLGEFEANSLGEPNELIALISPDGSTLAARPGGAGLPVADLGGAWGQALDGRAALSSVFDLDGEPRRATVVPVGGARPWGVLVTVAGDLAPAYFEDQLGSFGLGPGGIATVDAHAIAIFGSEPESAGRQVADPAELPVGVPYRAAVWSSGDQTNIAAWQPGTGYSTMFQQQTSLLFADLRAQQHDRDIVLTVVLALAVSGLVAFGLYREVAARRDRAGLTRLLEGLDDLVVLLGTDRTVRFASPSARTLLGVEPSSLVGCRLVDLVHRAVHPAEVRRVARLVTDSDCGPVLDVRLRTADGGERWFDLEASDLSADPHLSGVLVTCHDVGERRALQEKIARRARYDPLTGLPNRATFHERIENASRDAEAMGVAYGILFVDLDGFKPVNDSYGHAAGDRVLAELAARLSARLGDDVLVSRFGGDEFGVLLYDTDSETARRAAEDVVGAVSVPVAVGDLVVQVGASVGVAVSGEGRASPRARPEELLDAADRAMYKAKRAGGARCVVSATVSGSPATDPRRAVVARPYQGDAAAPGAQPPGTGRRREFVPAVPRPRAVLRSTAAFARSRLWSLATAMVVLVAVVGVGWWQQTHADDDARARRRAEREGVTASLAGYLSFADELLVPIASAEPWSSADRAANESILGQFATSSIGGPGSVTALLDTSAGVLASRPVDVAVPVGPDCEAWSAVLDGRAADAQVTVADGEARVYTLVPVVRQQTTTAVLMIGRLASDAAPTKQFEALGAAGLGGGGLSMVDSSGRVGFTWNRRLAGQPLVNPADLADVSGLPPGQARQVRAVGADSRVVLLAAPLQGVPGMFAVFQQPAADFYAGVREGQTALNAALFAIVAISVVGVAWSNDRRETALRRGETQLAVLLHNTHDVIVSTGRDGRVTFTSSATAVLLGLDPAQMQGREFTDFVHPDDTGRVREHLARPVPSDLTDVRLRRGDGAYLWFDVACSPGRGVGAGSGTVATCHEISVRNRLKDQLSYQAEHDVLTGLRNRAAFDRELAALGTGGRPDGTGPDRGGPDGTGSDGTGSDSGGPDGTGPDSGGPHGGGPHGVGPPYAVLFVDLDHFKPVNDTYGHQVGDEVLRIVAARLRGAAREGGSVCRVGGDEFAMILTGADVSLAEQVAARVLDVVSQPMSVGGAVVTLSATVGVATARCGSECAETTVRRADQAMYRAKLAGRGRFATHGD